MPSLRDLTRRVYLPWARVPHGQVVELPGRGGTTYVTDTPGPDPAAPTVVLLHALGCTGLLTWYPAIEPLSRRYRVVTLDQRWHGQGIRSADFSLADCADDVAALVDLLGLEDVMVCGYSMGSIVAQRVWRQHPDLVQGLVLCATTDRFRLTAAERLFFTGMGTTVPAVRAASKVASGRPPRAPAGQPRDVQDWALRELRSTSPWAVAQAINALGRHHSRPWLGSIDVPTAVVVGTKDKVIPAPRQVALARAVPGATLHDFDGGHAACVMDAETFVPVLLEAVATVNARRRDFTRRERP